MLCDRFHAERFGVRSLQEHMILMLSSSHGHKIAFLVSFSYLDFVDLGKK